MFPCREFKRAKVEVEDARAMIERVEVGVGDPAAPAMDVGGQATRLKREADELGRPPRQRRRLVLIQRPATLDRAVPAGHSPRRRRQAPRGRSYGDNPSLQAVNAARRALMEHRDGRLCHCPLCSTARHIPHEPPTRKYRC